MSVKLIRFDSDDLVMWTLSLTHYSGSICDMSPLSSYYQLLCIIWSLVILCLVIILAVVGLCQILTVRACYMSRHSVRHG